MTGENFDRHVFIGALLTLTMALILALYWWGEPTRMAASAGNIWAEQVERGVALYSGNCTSCHGAGGEGSPGLGPALNTRAFLDLADDTLIFDTIRDGRPNTAMPAWGQPGGGPFTDEDLRSLTAFIRNWQTTAPLGTAPSTGGDPVGGAVTFSTICYACHGLNGQGTNAAPALNDPEKLGKFDDAWYREAITQGRPSRGMPTWGRVLSPSQINDLVAFIRSWATTATVSGSSPLVGDSVRGAVIFSTTCIACHGPAGAGSDRAPQLNNTAFLSATTDETLYRLIAQGRLEKGMPKWGQVLAPSEIADLVAYIRSWQTEIGGKGPLSGDLTRGANTYSSNCAVCHGTEGQGGIGPSLKQNAFVGALPDAELIQFIKTGRPGTTMGGFGGLSDQEIADVIALLRAWGE